VVTILNQIYEVDFKDFSYGFRPGRSPHQALDALTVGIQRKRVNWVLDAEFGRTTSGQIGHHAGESDEFPSEPNILPWVIATSRIPT
jgi:hypothetical protein